MTNQKVLRYDYDTVSNDGSDNLTRALLELLNSYPGLDEVSVNEITFQLLDETKGIAFFANPSVAILTERESITGHVNQTCSYAFTVVYRIKSSSTRKERVKEWLDNLGRWLEEVEYPNLSEGRSFLKISRLTQGYLYNTSDDKTEDWTLSMQALYQSEFDR